MDHSTCSNMLDDTDVNHAISQSPLLKITVFDKVQAMILDVVYCSH